jgi:diguanylate cyclase (GGDEF)-like protein
MLAVASPDLAAPMAVPLAQLGRLMPMHILVSADGRVRSIGPTLAKVLPVPVPPGTPFFAVFEVRRPGGVTGMPALAARAGARLTLSPKGEARNFRAFAVPLDDGGLIVKTGFGIDVFSAVADFGLTDADFAATDMTVEMLYLQEAKSAVMGELASLNRRLDEARQTAETQALTDTLTGLANRRALDQRLATVAAAGLDFSLMHLDLDFFKAVNDTLGHAAGDHVLREVARILEDGTRRGDTVSRIGGDEFLIVLPGLTDPPALMAVAERLIVRLSAPIDHDGSPCCISGSIGIARSVDYAQLSLDRMLADADAALYASKNAGRGRAAFHHMSGP